MAIAKFYGKGKVDDLLDSKTTLTPVYSDTPTFSAWTFSDVSDGITDIQQPVFVPSTGGEPRWGISFDFEGATRSAVVYSGDENATNLSFEYGDEGIELHLTAARTHTDILGYRLGSQSDKPIASEAEAEALRNTKLDKSGGRFGNTVILFDSEGIGIFDLASGRRTMLTSSPNVFLARKSSDGTLYVYAAPNKSGTLALTSDIAVKAVKLNGTALTPDVNGAVDIPALPLTGGILFNNSIDTPTLIVRAQNSSVAPLRVENAMQDGTRRWVFEIGPDGTLSYAYSDGPVSVYNLPAQSGTLALLSDIPSVTGFAPLASPAFTGAPTAPTPTTGDNSTKVATTAFVQAAMGGITPGPDNSKLDSTSAAPAFDATATYAVSERVTYNGKLYKCTTAVTTAGAWDSTMWAPDDMTTPDATLDVTVAKQLRVVAADGTVLWAQGYDLKTASSATLSNEAGNKYDFAVNATNAVSLTIPTPISGKVGDFILDVTNPALDDTAAGWATAFDTTAIYNVGDVVSYDNKQWRCTTAVETAGAWTGSTNWEEALPYFTLSGLGTTFNVVVPAGENLTDMLTFAPGDMAELYFTQTSFTVNSLPAWKIVRQDVEAAS